MFYVSLGFSGALLVVSVGAAAWAASPLRAALKWAVAIPLLPLLLTLLLTPVVIQSCLTALGLSLVAGLRRSPRSRTALVSLAAFLMTWVFVGTQVLGDERKYARLRAEFPYESLAGRIRPPGPSPSPTDAMRLDGLERRMDGGDERASVLGMLHETPHRILIGSDAFGRTLLGYPWWKKYLPSREQRLAPLQPEELSGQVSDGIIRWAGLPTAMSLWPLHENCVVDFVNPRGFGFVKDRRHVAGFEPHGFTKVPETAGEWKVASLDLVGILRHENPVVYVSAKLPRMEELRDAPTRPPDAFESAALEALRKGADLHLGDGPEATRFVGAIRSTKQCLACHGGERGALLGAFTYRLRPAK